MPEVLQLPDDINKGAGRPKGVRTWRLVMREAFWYLEHAPEKLERRLGIPMEMLEKYRKKDLQLFLVLRQIDAAAKGDKQALDMLMDRMDGKPNQPIELSGEVTANVIDYDRMPLDLQNKWLEEKVKYINKKNVDINSRRKRHERKPNSGRIKGLDKKKPAEHKTVG